jgi:hypothetical protein
MAKLSRVGMRKQIKNNSFAVVLIQFKSSLPRDIYPCTESLIFFVPVSINKSSVKHVEFKFTENTSPGINAKIIFK